MEVMGADPGVRAARSFKNGAAPGSTYVQPRIGWYLWLYSMCIVARRDFGCPFPGWYIPRPVLW